MRPLSIIVPIYNVERYLRECLDSIKTQSYSSFQAVMIDDGSKDESAKIAECFVKSDERFVLLRQENAGLGATRNAGLEYIFSGKNRQDTHYIGLVDSDDVIASDYYENLIYALECNKTQVAKTRNICVFRDKSYDSNIFLYKRKKERGIIRKVKNNDLADKSDPWRSVFTVSLLKDLRFPRVRFAEDVGFGVCVNVLTQKAALTKSARYFYRLREGSLTKEMSHNPSEMFEVIRFMRDFLSEQKLLYTHRIPAHILRPCSSYLQKYPSYFSELKAFVESLELDSKALKQNPILKSALDSQNIKEFMARTQSLKEWRRDNFRIHLSRKQMIIKLFGRVMYQK